MGDDESVRSILQLWSEGQEVRGWARLWAQAYGRFMEIVSNNPRLNRTAVVIRYEDLCGQPEESLSRLLDHANLRPHGQFIQDWGQRLSLPTYYEPSFTDDEESAIVEETNVIAAQYGYPPTMAELATSVTQASA